MREIRLSGSEGGGAPSLSLPLSLSIPSGDQGWTVPRTFWGRKKQVKRLPVRSAEIAQLRRVSHRVSGERLRILLGLVL